MTEQATGSDPIDEMYVIRFPAPTEDHVRALHEFVTARGWEIEDFGFPDPDGEIDAEAGWRYPASYGGTVINHVDDITPSRLRCQFRLEFDDGPQFVVVAAGNHAGCQEHITREWRFPLGEDDKLRFADLAALLDDLERAARERDPRALIECRFFGPCGSPS